MRNPRAQLIRSVAVLSLLLANAFEARSQDAIYRPKNQLIPAPGCLAMKGAWEGGSTACTEASHQLWLKDVQHWRMERKIRIG